MALAWELFRLMTVRRQQHQEHCAPGASFSPLYHLGLKCCLLCCALHSCFGVLNCFTGQLMNVIACGCKAASYAIQRKLSGQDGCVRIFRS